MRRAFITKVSLALAIPLLVFPFALLPLLGTDHIEDECTGAGTYENLQFIG